MKFNKNINWVVKNNLCTGCGICSEVCNQKAIAIGQLQDSGIFTPLIKNDLCLNCGECLKICYGFSVDQASNFDLFQCCPDEVLGTYTGLYTGFSNDQTLRFKSSSGGLVSSLLLFLFKEKLIHGAIIAKMDDDDPTMAKAFIATNETDVLLGMGSKYCPVSIAECLAKLEINKRYAVVGLPCHIYGIRKLSECNPRIKKSIFVCIGIICGGMPSSLGTQYVLEHYGLKKEGIKKLQYRGYGWPGNLLIQTKAPFNYPKQICLPYPEYWKNTFGYFCIFRCTVCHDGFNELADISCGDAWLPKILKNDSVGTSLIITRTEKGESLLKAAIGKGYVCVSAIDRTNALACQKGLVQFKNLGLSARLNLLKFFHRSVPVFDSRRLAAAKFGSYLLALDFYLGHVFASRKNLWWLLDLYIKSKSNVRSLVGKLFGKFT